MTQHLTLVRSHAVGVPEIPVPAVGLAPTGTESQPPASADPRAVPTRPGVVPAAPGGHRAAAPVASAEPTPAAPAEPTPAPVPAPVATGSTGATESRQARPDNDAGMSTVEYAVGTVVAAAFAAVLYRIVTGDSIVAGLTSLVQSALDTGF